MELMSMLLLCSFFVTLPQALGVNRLSSSDITLNSLIMIENSALTRNRGHRVLNRNVSPFVTAITELQALFLDKSCQQCISCMDRAIKAQNNNIINNRHPQELFYDILQENFQSGDKHHKRSVPKDDNTEPKKVRNKSKNAVVTKFANVEGKVYAIKVEENNKQKSEPTSTCQVYNVNDISSCKTNESAVTSTKRRINKKKNIKSKDKDMKSGSGAYSWPLHMKSNAVFKKRPVREDNPLEQESFMPSIEEYY